MPKWPWTDRKSNFDFPLVKWPVLLERWSGTPTRLKDRLAGFAAALVKKRPFGGWFNQENVGHLLDLVQLPATRTAQILACKVGLVAADEAKPRPTIGVNFRTNQANQNAAQINDLLCALRPSRVKSVACAELIGHHFGGGPPSREPSRKCQHL